MQELQRLLQEQNIPFDADGNRIRWVTINPMANRLMIWYLLFRCFPHVINIAVKSGLALLTKIPKVKKITENKTPNTGWETEDKDDGDDGTSMVSYGDDFSADWVYNQAIEADPIVQCWKLIANCWASGQHHENLQATITDANEAGLFSRDDKGVDIELPSLQLLCDIDTRWSSIYLMVEQALDLYPVSFSNF